MMRRETILSVATAVSLCLPLLPDEALGAEPSARLSGAPDPARVPQITAKSAVLVDAVTGQTLYEQDADAVRYPASLTKIMTALLALEQDSRDDEVTVSANAAAVGEATAHLTAGDRLSLHDLICAVLLPSANDASVAAAEHIAGSLGAFVDQMNARSAELELTATNFENPHGLHHDDHVTSARDLARLSCEALKLPDFRRIVALGEVEISLHRRGEENARQLKLTNNNRLLRRDNGNYWPAADGIKTGYTRRAGRCLAASATSDGWELVCVVLGCEDSWTDARTLLEWGFANFARQRVVSAAETTAEIHIIDGDPARITAVAKSSIDMLVPVGGPTPTLRVSEAYPTAPVAAGDQVGELVVSRLDGTELRASLVAPRDVPRSLSARVRDHRGGMIAAILGLALLGALFVHGAVAKAAGTRRRGVSKGVRRDHKAGPRAGGRDRGSPPRRKGRSGPGTGDC